MTIRTTVRELMIFDSGDKLSSHEAKKFLESHKYGAWTVAAKGIKNASDLSSALASYCFVTQLCFCTHGSPGSVAFDQGAINISNLNSILVPKDFFGLLRPDKNSNFLPRMLFMGCNTAEGTVGRDFLIAAGKHFFKDKGGIVGGTTNANLYLFFGGTRVPKWGKLIAIRLDGQGNVVATK